MSLLLWIASKQNGLVFISKLKTIPNTRYTIGHKRLQDKYSNSFFISQQVKFYLFKIMRPTGKCYYHFTIIKNSQEVNENS